MSSSLKLSFSTSSLTLTSISINSCCNLFNLSTDDKEKDDSDKEQEEKYLNKEQKDDNNKKTKAIEQSPETRQHNFSEVSLGYDEELAKKEASRCLGCKKPSCVSGCPVNIDIPKFINYNNMEEIYEITSILDEISNYVIGKFGIFKEGLYYDRFILHCRYLLQRTGEFPKKDSLFKYLIKNDRNSYEEEWNCVEDVAHIIENRKHYCLDENEKFYLFIHLVRLNRK